MYLEILGDLIDIANLTEEEEEAMFNETNTVKPPEWMKAAVRRGKKIRDKQPESNQCCTRTGLARANQIENGDNLSKSTIKRMKSFFSRHSGQTSFKDKGEGTKREQAINLWGAPYSKEGVDKAIKWCDAQINKLEKK